MVLRPLDLDIAIYRDRVQATHRPSGKFADQQARFGFSSDTSIVAIPRYLEDTIVRAIAQVVQAGGFVMRDAIAHIVGCETLLRPVERATIETALVEAGFRNVVFEID